MDKTIETNGITYAKYHLKADLLCLGERMRGNTYRACLDVFTNTALAGAFKARFPHPDRTIYAAGYFLKRTKETLVYSPRDRYCGSSKVPLQIEYFSDVEAEIYVLQNDWTIKWEEEFDLYLGAMKSKGFGWCRLKKTDEVARQEPKEGCLNCRILDNEKTLKFLGVDEVIDSVYGYLFVPDHGKKGHYERALFEGSKIKAQPFLVKSHSENSQENNDDPIYDVLKNIVNNVKKEAYKPLEPTFCHNTADIFEDYGYEVTKLYLKDKQQQRGKVRPNATTMLSILEYLKDNEYIQQNRAIGRQILKSIPTLLEHEEFIIGKGGQDV